MRDVSIAAVLVLIAGCAPPDGPLSWEMALWPPDGAGPELASATGRASAKVESDTFTVTLAGLTAEGGAGALAVLWTADTPIVPLLQAPVLTTDPGLLEGLLRAGEAPLPVDSAGRAEVAVENATVDLALVRAVTIEVGAPVRLALIGVIGNLDEDGVAPEPPPESGGHHH